MEMEGNLPFNNMTPSWLLPPRDIWDSSQELGMLECLGVYSAGMDL